jgi:predicted deacylase
MVPRNDVSAAVGVSFSVKTSRGDAGAAREIVRAIRVGGQSIGPGQARVVPLGLPGRTDAGDAIPIWVAAGSAPGPRVTVIAAPRGFEVGAARVATGLRSIIDPSGMRGGLIVAPVLRPGGRFAARGQAVRDGAAWRFPGDPGGSRRAREAFTVFSELVVGSSLVLVLTAADPGFAAPLTLYGNFDDPRARRLASSARASACVHAKPAPGSLSAAVTEMGALVLELRGPTESGTDEFLTAAVLALLAASGAGVVGAAALASLATPAMMVTHLSVVRAPVGGLLENEARAGALVERGGLLARVVPPLMDRASDICAPHDGVVLEATTRRGARTRAALFVVGRLSRIAIARRRGADRAAIGTAHPAAPSAVVGVRDAHLLRVGWVERVSLPSLGVDRLRAKIDTGARTSALHVTRMTTVGMTDGPHRRPIVELTLPAGSRRGAPPATVRVLVRDHVQVKDTSGRTERRPVIETTLRLGSIERRIRITLTNRGDMLFPLLIGRTALSPGVVVDPTRRLLLRHEGRTADGARPSAKQITPES